MKITPTKENNTYEKVLEYLDPENYKPEAETDQYKTSPEQDRKELF